MFLNTYKNEDKFLMCDCCDCTKNADVLLELVAGIRIPLCKQHCYNTLKNLGIEEELIKVFKTK